MLPVELIAAPTGGDLLNACRQSITSGFDSTEGMMCTWYVTPCDCSLDTDIPRVCLPESLPANELALDVITGLTEQPELQEKDAALAAALVLSRKYPCQETQ